MVSVGLNDGLHRGRSTVPAHTLTVDGYTQAQLGTLRDSGHTSGNAAQDQDDPQTDPPHSPLSSPRVSPRRPQTGYGTPRIGPVCERSMAAPLGYCLPKRPSTSGQTSSGRSARSRDPPPIILPGVPRPIALFEEAEALIGGQGEQRAPESAVHWDPLGERLPAEAGEQTAEAVAKPAIEGPLKVVVSQGSDEPARIMRFDHGIQERLNEHRAEMLVFEHLDGARFCEELYGHFLLPNGKLAHFYHEKAGQITTHLAPLAPPPMPDVCFEGGPAAERAPWHQQQQTAEPLCFRLMVGFLPQQPL
ncbi:hypothetical protein WJX72_004995 [[Myrmecia] bisecta]|uniref:Uncharacterized protein n=1 Tax=[Myrmecia] bisecta TaxID=41462 RepID=A0AAW1QQE0_9CHLO